jgi:two-component system chemotaxis response regulator CheY
MDKNVSLLMQRIKVLVVEDEPYTRKVIRTLLSSIGVKHVHEASDGAEGLNAVRAVAPDIVLLDWDMPNVDGAEFMRTVRSPATFPHPNVPVIMLTAHGEKSRVVQAVQLGVHEYLVKPVSSQALLARIVVVLAKPRPIVQIGKYYGPEPRKISTYKPNDVGLEQLGLAS